MLPLTITDDRYVKGYKLIITDSSGAAVRTIQNKEDRPENRDVQNLLARLAYVKTGHCHPPDYPLGRDGGRGDGGSRRDLPLSRGSLGRQREPGKDPMGTVIVKNTPPKIALSAPYLIFSPDGDGNKDTLPIQQAGSHEDTWTGTIQDISGQTVRTYTWTDSEPPAFRMGREDQYGDPGTGRRLQLPHLLRQTGREMPPRPSWTISSSIPVRPPCSLLSIYSYFSPERKRGEKSDDIRPEGPRCHRDREVEPCRSRTIKALRGGASAG